MLNPESDSKFLTCRVESGSVQALYQLGRSYHDQGRRDAAAFYYRKALSLDPTLAEAYNDLGTLAQEQGRWEEAAIWYRSALTVDPDMLEACYNLGNLYKEKKEWPEAEFYLRKALERNPSLGAAYFTLGVVYFQQERMDEAIACWRKTLDLQPEHTQARTNLAKALKNKGRNEEAAVQFHISLSQNPQQPSAWLALAKIHEDNQEWGQAKSCYLKALEADPSLSEVYIKLGSKAIEQGEADQALDYLEKALTLHPDSAEVWGNLGNAYRQKGETEQAAECFRQVIRLDPAQVQAYNNLGLILHEQGRLEESLEQYEQALEVNPDLLEAWINKGNLLKDGGRILESLSCLRKAVRQAPDFPPAHTNLAIILLLAGFWKEGWREYEWRWKLKGVKFREELKQPRWNGEDLQGKRILLHFEQGLGDTIQFVRYVPLVTGKGGRVLLECQKELKSLLASMDGPEEIVSSGESLPDHDLQCPLMSLPGLFRTEIDSVPVAIPYLFADPKKVLLWGEKTNRSEGGPQVGLVWAGSPRHTNDRNRSLTLERLLPLLRLPGIRWYSLQKGEAASQVKTLTEQVDLTDVTEELTDFSETAALIEHLDLVITVDTAVAHLAGALGKPVWVLLHYSPDWRWLLEREDSPWYPTMRLFRQERYGDWDTVMERVAVELRRRFL